jgi:hypothetical protein
MANIVKKPASKVVKVNWEDKLAEYAKQTADSETVAAGTFASIKDGLHIGGNRMADDQAEVVVLDYICENNMYKGAFNPKNPQPPTCYAFGRKEEELVPHEKAQGYWDEESETFIKPESCAECPMNEWPESGEGGKPCKNMRRVAFISANGLDTAEAVEGADLVQLKVPPTSLKPWKQYIRAVAQSNGHPMFAVTTVRAEKDEWDRVFFSATGAVEQDLWPAIEARHEACEETMTQAYPDYKEPAPAAKGKPSKVGSKSPAKSKPSKVGSK